VTAVEAPLWVKLAARVIPRVPAGRHRTMTRLSRLPRQPFWMRMRPELGGQCFLCDLRDANMREACFNTAYEAQETALMLTILRPGMRFVDAGANFGYFTLIGAWLVGGAGKVVSVEADPRMYAILAGNVRRNGLSQVTTLPLALSDAEGKLTLAGFDESGANFGLSRMGGPANGNAFEVPARPLEMILGDLGVGDVDLVKLDVEGAEDLVLQGMAGGLASGRYRRILLEAHPSYLAERGKTVADIVRMLAGAGYRAMRIDHSREANRAAVYEWPLPLSRILTPWDESRPLDEWAHMLWLAPGVEAPL
jgi:FkbM family methyltransferase